MPQLCVLVPPRAVNVGTEPQVAHDAAFACRAPQVLEDLRMWREHPAPGRVQLERIRIEISRHVAGAPRVGIRPPGATEPLITLEHEELVDAGLVQLDRHAEASKPCADDGHTHVAQTDIGPEALSTHPGGPEIWARLTILRGDAWGTEVRTHSGRPVRPVRL